MKRLWGEAAVGVYELAPLRRRDVSEAARQRTVPPDDFLAAIAERAVEPLAIKPVTLNFLLNSYFEHQELPARQADLYREGCLLLCEEIRKGHRVNNPGQCEFLRQMAL